MSEPLPIPMGYKIFGRATPR